MVASGSGGPNIVASGSEGVASGSGGPNTPHAGDSQMETGESNYEADETPPSAKRKRRKVLFDIFLLHQYLTSFENNYS